VVNSSVLDRLSWIVRWFTHRFWKRQKLKEQQLAVAERFSVLRQELLASSGIQEGDAFVRSVHAREEMAGLLYMVPVLFEKKEVVTRVDDLKHLRIVDNNIHGQRVELQCYLFAEALDLPFDKIKYRAAD
jgi:hypothetical protein